MFLTICIILADDIHMNAWLPATLGPSIVNRPVSQTWLYLRNYIFSTSLRRGLALMTQPLVFLISDFHDILENLVTIHPECFILGDFNHHLDT